MKFLYIRDFTVIKLVSHKVQLNKIIQKVRLCWEGSTTKLIEFHASPGKRIHYCIKKSLTLNPYRRQPNPITVTPIPRSILILSSLTEVLWPMFFHSIKYHILFMLMSKFAYHFFIWHIKQYNYNHLQCPNVGKIITEHVAIHLVPLAAHR